MRFFNTEGPIKPEMHYHIPLLERFNWLELLDLIERQKYFVLHAPRQTGKTSALLQLMQKLNNSGDYRCCYVNVEPNQASRHNVALTIQGILSGLAENASIYLNDSFPEQHFNAILADKGSNEALKIALSRWSQQDSKPLILLIDEIDSLIGDSLISVLRQLRSGYANRPQYFPQSVVLCGVRDVRDYRIHSANSPEIITGGSAFNIKAVSLRLRNFNQEEVFRLLEQHTAETGQIFAEAAKLRISALSQGQPWLVNALANELIYNMKENRDVKRTITLFAVETAKENLITRRDTHLDQLVDKLQEPRVREVLQPILSSVADYDDFHPNQVSYVEDLGLIQVSPQGKLSIANPIYQEILPRELAWAHQMGIHQQTAWYINPDKRLNMNKLLAAFQEFFREHSEHWLERFAYKEAGPQLLLQAFLQRIVNGGGRIDREYGLGKMRTDLLIQWPLGEGFIPNQPIQKVVLELKVLHKSLEKTLSDGLEQTYEYGQRCGAESLHLLIFDRRIAVPWEEKIYQKTESFAGVSIQVWGA